MPYTLQQLQQMGAKPVTKSGFVTGEPESVKKGFMSKVGTFFKPLLDPTIGAAKGLASTATNVGQIGQSALDQTAGRVVNAFSGNGFTKANPNNEAIKQKVDEALAPTNFAQKSGKVIEQAAEFLAPIGAEAKVIGAADKGIGVLKLSKLTENLPGLLSKVGPAGEKILQAASRIAASATSAGVVTKAQGGSGEEVKTNAVLGGLVPVVGKGVGIVAEKASQKIETSLLKPTKAIREDGFNVKNVFKHDLAGSLEDTIAKGTQKLNDLGSRLKETISASDSKININDIANRVENDLLNTKKTSTFGMSKATQKAVSDLKEEVINVLGNNGEVDLATAQELKRAAGAMGSWVNGHLDPAAKASEAVYSKFYSIIKGEIEKAAGPAVKEINTQMSEIIPIVNAAIRRLPIAERNSALGLSDAIGLFTSIGHPGALPLEVANFLSRRGGTAKVLNKIANPVSKVGKKLIGK